MCNSAYLYPLQNGVLQLLAVNFSPVKGNLRYCLMSRLCLGHSISHRVCLVLAMTVLYPNLVSLYILLKHLYTTSCARPQGGSQGGFVAEPRHTRLCRDTWLCCDKKPRQGSQAASRGLARHLAAWQSHVARGRGLAAWPWPLVARVADRGTYLPRLI